MAMSCMPATPVPHSVLSGALNELEGKRGRAVGAHTLDGLLDGRRPPSHRAASAASTFWRRRAQSDALREPHVSETHQRSVTPVRWLSGWASPWLCRPFEHTLRWPPTAPPADQKLKGRVRCRIDVDTVIGAPHICASQGDTSNPE